MSCSAPHRQLLPYHSHKYFPIYSPIHLSSLFMPLDSSCPLPFLILFDGLEAPHPSNFHYLVRRRWAELPAESVASRSRAVGWGGQRRKDRSSSCSGTKGRRGPRSGEFPRLLERGGGWTGGVARRGALFRGQGGSTATFRTGEREEDKEQDSKD